MVSARPQFLEVARFADAEEGIVGVLSVQRVGLQPFFAARNPVGPRVGLHAELVRHQIGNDCLPGQRRQCDVVGFKFRARHDPARDTGLAPIPGQNVRRNLRGNRAGVETRGGIDGSCQGVRQRLVEHVVGILAGEIAKSAKGVPQDDLEAAQTGLDGGNRAISAPAILLAIEWEVVFKHDDRKLRCWKRSGHAPSR